LSHWHNILGL